MRANFKIENTVIEYDFDSLESDRIVINSLPYNYEVIFLGKEKIKSEIDNIAKYNNTKHFIFIDESIEKLYGQVFFADQDTLSLVAIEDNKALSTATLLIDKLQEMNFTKREFFLSIGGGITQDISAFARAVYKRGVNWVYIPTTLLAMGDSCIGAKSCLNYGGVKNQLGLFSAPKYIYIYIDLLKTLSYRDILSGYGEIIKLAIVGGQSSIDKFIELTENQGNDKLKNIEKLIKLSLIVKKSVIEIDEFEDDIRKALNYGHTIGHAIEPLVDYQIPHGVAVSIGMFVENLLASRFGSLSKENADFLNKKIINFIDEKSLELLKQISIDDMVKNMKRDKKALSDDIYVAVPFQIGYFDILKIKADSNFKNILEIALNKLANI